MRTFILILSLFVFLFSRAQDGTGKHFWGEAVITAGIHFTIGKAETPGAILAGFSVGYLKEWIDQKRGGEFSRSDLWADATGCVAGFMISDSIKRRRKHEPQIKAR